MVCPYPETRGSTHPCGNNIDVRLIMQKNKRETHEGTCVGQSVGVCGGNVELVKLREPVWASGLAVVELAALS